MKILWFVVLGWAARSAVVACSVYSPPAPPPDTQPEAGAGDPCTRACERLRALRCPEGSPSGDTCEAQCLAIEDSGIASVNPECLAQITACTQIDGCS